MKWLSNKEIERLYADKEKCRVKCKCGHTVTILNPKGYQICRWCQNYVFLNPKLEFEYRIKEKLIKERRKNNEKYNSKED